jgi:hypothetical protein
LNDDNKLQKSDILSPNGELNRDGLMPRTLSCVRSTWFMQTGSALDQYCASGLMEWRSFLHQGKTGYVSSFLLPDANASKIDREL